VQEAKSFHQNAEKPRTLQQLTTNCAAHGTYAVGEPESNAGDNS
jgi:hypothetical protein